MKVPSAINVLGEWVKIRYVDEIESDQNELIYGEYRNDHNLIIIRKGDPDVMAKTLLHELGHALFAKSGWSDKLGHATEEALCVLLENLSQIYFLNGGKKRIRWRRKSPLG